jgi:hypothetical protein
MFEQRPQRQRGQEAEQNDQHGGRNRHRCQIKLKVTRTIIRIASPNSVILAIRSTGRD